MQCDGYAAYPSFANKSGGRITFAACWAHARRKFHEAMEAAPPQAGWLMLQIQQLYRIEKKNFVKARPAHDCAKPCEPARAA